MKTLLPLRLGIFIIPGLFYVTQKQNGKYDIDSKPAAHRHLRLLKDFGFNLTFKSVNQITLGQMTENGSYDGLLGLIDNNQLDTLVFPIETFIQSPPGDFGPVVCSFPNVIMTLCSSPKITIKNLVTATNMFDKPTYTLLTIVPFVWLLIMGVAASSYSLWNIITMALGQNYYSYLDCSKRLLQAGLVFMFLFVEFVFLSSFSTDMAIVQPPKLIETLEDLYLSTLKPIFFTTDNLYVQFMTSESARFSNVWKQVQQCGLDKCLIHGNIDMLSKVDFSLANPEIAVVYSKVYLPAMVNHMCNGLGKEYKKLKKDGQSFFVSQPFSSVNFAQIINRNTGSDVRHRIIQYSYFAIESGYTEKGWKDTEQFVEPVYGSHCPQTFFKDENEVTLPEPVSLIGFSRVLITLLVAVVFGATALITEITLARLQNSPNLVAIEPLSVQSTEPNSEVETSDGIHMDSLSSITH